jgi:membrane protein YdbS with pleckstrin-like domain
MEQILDSGERILYRTRMGWAILAPVAVLFLVSVWSYSRGGGALGTLCLALAGLWGIIGGTIYSAVEVGVTDRNLVLRSEIDEFDPLSAIPLSRIREVQVRQGPLGRMLGYGTVRIELADGESHTIWAVARPEELKGRLGGGAGATTV